VFHVPFDLVFNPHSAIQQILPYWLTKTRFCRD
jgi:hypothetical protein